MFSLSICDDLGNVIRGYAIPPGALDRILDDMDRAFGVGLTEIRDNVYVSGRYDGETVQLER